MNPETDARNADLQDLVITLVRAPRATSARLTERSLKEWWCPKPWPRGAGLIAARRRLQPSCMPDGAPSTTGCFVEIGPQRDRVPPMLLADWRPATPWLAFSAVISMSDEGEGTRYVATVMHPDKATADRHEEMGFFDGWNTCIDQLEAFAGQLAAPPDPATPGRTGIGRRRSSPRPSRRAAAGP